MKKIGVKLLLLLGMGGSLHAQEDSTHRIKTSQLPEFILSYNKFRERKAYVAQPVLLVNRQTIAQSLSPNSATVLERTGEIHVQRSQQGGGSPVLRGFEASRVLLVVDGVRMNNAIYRAGHLQNAITIDPLVLDKVEVLYGPGSTLYGSDALGGVVQFITRSPELSQKGISVGGNALLRTATANNEETVHADLNIGGRRFASLSSATWSAFGDLRQGGWRPPTHDSFGKRYEFIDPSPGSNDAVIGNPDPNIQRGSGYTQYDLLQKFVFAPGKNTTHTLNLQLSNSSDIPRYDRLTEYSGGKLRYANWYYGPQFRALGAYEFRTSGLGGFFDEAMAGISYQAIEESRHQRNRGSSNLQSRIESVDVVGYHVDLRKSGGRHEFTLGTDGQYNKVASEAHQRDVTGERTLSTRYPDGGSTMLLAAVYGHYLLKVKPDKLVFNAGARLNYTSLMARFDEQRFYPFPFRTASQQHTALSGNAGMIAFPHRRWRISTSLASGFRSPNVDDLAKVFESAGGRSVIVPNPDLKPEKTYTADLRLSYNKTGILTVEGGAFVTRFVDAIVVAPFRLAGQDSIVYEGKLTAVAAATNQSRAWIHGFTGAATLTPLPGMSLYSTITYTYGRYRDPANTVTPLDHIPPVFGKTGISYGTKSFSTEAYALYNGWKKAADYSGSGEDNLLYATRDGMPGWYTLNLRATVQLSRVFQVQCLLENLLDRNYRTFASGISAPGRNLVLSLRASF